MISDNCENGYKIVKQSCCSRIFFAVVVLVVVNLINLVQVLLKTIHLNWIVIVTNVNIHTSRNS